MNNSNQNDSAYKKQLRQRGFLLRMQLAEKKSCKKAEYKCSCKTCSKEYLVKGADVAQRFLTAHPGCDTWTEYVKPAEVTVAPEAAPSSPAPQTVPEEAVTGDA